jgi:DNA-binding transcriptional ArsR family regulator
MKQYFRNMTFKSDSTEPLTLEDPRAMRALAHPVRLAILDYLRAAGPATATECAEAVGESPSACSYHLRTLARWGFVEEVPGNDRRARPWRRLSRRIAWSSAAAGTPEQAAAGREMLDATLAHDEHTVATYLANEARVDPAWRASAVFLGRTLTATPEEIAELTRAVEQLLDRYAGDPSGSRPRGAASVRVMFRAVPLVPDLLGSRPAPAEESTSPDQPTR